LKVLNQFLAEVSRTYKKAESMKRDLNTMLKEIYSMKYAIINSPAVNLSLIKDLEKIEKQLKEVKWQFEGQTPPASQEERIPQPVPLNDRLYYLAFAHYDSTAPITQMERDALNIIQKKLPNMESELENARLQLQKIKKLLNEKEVRWTPGRSNK